MGPLDIGDLLGHGKIGEKLLDVVSQGIGSLYEPTKIRKKAKALGEGIKEISKATTEAEVESKKITKKGELELKKLEERTQSRINFVENRRQENIEQIIFYAYSQLPPEGSEECVDSDWITRFFDKAQEYSDEEIQMLWGKILAGEVTKPGSFSYLSLEVLTWMDKRIAKLFQNYCSFVWSNAFVFIHHTFRNDYWKKYGITWANIRNFESLGLITITNVGIPFEPNEEKTFKYVNSSYKVINLKKGIQSLPVHLLSPVGTELSTLCDASPIPKYIEKLISAYSGKFEFREIDK